MNTIQGHVDAIHNTRTSLWHAFGGIWRLTIAQSFGFPQWRIAGGPTLTISALMLITVPEANIDRYLSWFLDVYLMLLLPALVFLSGAALVRSDMKPTTVDYVLSRPIPRTAHALFRFTAHTLFSQAIFLVMFCILLGVGLYLNVTEALPAAPHYLLAQVIIVTTFTALGFLFGSITAKFLVLGLLYAGLVEAGLGNIPMQINRLSILHHTRTITNWAPADPTSYIWISIGVSLAIAAALVIAATIIFSLREFSGTPAADS